MAKEYVVGIDSGTSVVKTALFDMRGNEVAVNTRNTPVIEKNGECQFLFGIAIVVKSVNCIPNLRAVGSEDLCFKVVVKSSEPVQDALLLHTKPERYFFIGVKSIPVKRPQALAGIHACTKHDRLGKECRRCCRQTKEKRQKDCRLMKNYFHIQTPMFLTCSGFLY